MFHLYFNITGVVVCMILFYSMNAVFHFDFVSGVVDQRGIAIVHTIFNIITTSILLPCSAFLEKLAIATIKDDEQDEEFALLDSLLLNTPAIAVERSRTVVNEMAEIAIKGFTESTSSINNYTDEFSDKIHNMEKAVDKYEDKLGTYLVQLTEQDMTTEDSCEVNKILHVINDFEILSIL